MAEKKSVNIINRKANFNYHIEQKFIAGIVLTGSEVKSIRSGNANISDAYCMFEDGILLIKNMHVSEFKQASHYNHVPLRNRILLLNKKELNKIQKLLGNKGTAVFPVKLYEADRKLLKLEIGVGKGKKSFDKREDIKAKDVQREIARLK